MATNGDFPLVAIRNIGKRFCLTFWINLDSDDFRLYKPKKSLTISKQEQFPLSTLPSSFNKGSRYESSIPYYETSPADMTVDGRQHH